MGYTKGGVLGFNSDVFNQIKPHIGVLNERGHETKGTITKVGFYYGMPETLFYNDNVKEVLSWFFAVHVQGLGEQDGPNTGETLGRWRFTPLMMFGNIERESQNVIVLMVVLHFPKRITHPKNL